MMRTAVFVLITLTVLCPRQLAAQRDSSYYNTTPPRWIGHFTVASANVLFSGLTAGITQELQGGSFRDGFTRGALGGLVVYGGKRIAVENFAGAGLIGREVTAVGASMVRNAADAVGLFDRFVLPVGIARVYWSRAQPQSWQVKIDASTLAWTIYGIAERQLKFDASQSLSAGAPVFRAPGRIIEVANHGEAGGITGGGVIFLSDIPTWGEAYLRTARAHERVHVLQSDQLFLTINEPHDDALLRRLPFGNTLNRWLDLNVVTEVVWLITPLIVNHGHRPWEMEANYLAR